MRLCAVAIAVCFLGLTAKAQSLVDPFPVSGLVGKWEVKMLDSRGEPTEAFFNGIYTITNSKSLTFKMTRGDKVQSTVIKSVGGKYIAEVRYGHNGLIKNQLTLSVANDKLIVVMGSSTDHAEGQRQK